METFPPLLALCGEFPSQKPVTRSFDVFFDLPWRNGWVNNQDAGDLRRHRVHNDATVMRYIALVLEELVVFKGLLFLYIYLHASVLVIVNTKFNQNCHHCGYRIFKYIFFEAKISFLIKIMEVLP